MPRRYQDPPIIEALCEIQFGQDTPWDLTLPGLIYDQVQDDFPIKQTPSKVTLRFSTDPDALLRDPSILLRFKRADHSAIIQIGPRLLAVNQLKPYSSWEKFLPLIQKGLAAYRDVVRPTSIHRVTLRYINRVTLPSTESNITQFFEFRPHLGPAFADRTIYTFITGVEFAYQNDRDRLRIELTRTDPEDPDSIGFLLDLQYYLLRPNAIELDNIFDWIEIAHEQLEAGFESCLTPDLRQLFAEVHE